MYSMRHDQLVRGNYIPRGSGHIHILCYVEINIQFTSYIYSLQNGRLGKISYSPLLIRWKNLWQFSPSPISWRRDLLVIFFLLTASFKLSIFDFFKFMFTVQYFLPIFIFHILRPILKGISTKPMTFIFKGNAEYPYEIPSVLNSNGGLVCGTSKYPHRKIWDFALINVLEVQSPPPHPGFLGGA